MTPLENAVCAAMREKLMGNHLSQQTIARTVLPPGYVLPKVNTSDHDWQFWDKVHWDAWPSRRQMHLRLEVPRTLSLP